MRRAGEGRSLTERQTGRQETGGAPGQEPRGQGGKGQASPPSALGLPNDCPSPGLPPTEWEFTGTGGGPGHSGDSSALAVPPPSWAGGKASGPGRSLKSWAL